MASGGSVLYVDAYDSFSQNIVALLHQELDVHVSLVKVDTNIEKTYGISLQDFLARFDAVVLGPGPGNPNNPEDVGNLYSLIDAAAVGAVPLLGICLGFQVLCIKYGLRIERMKRPCHGHAKKIHVLESNLSSSTNPDIFEGLDVSDIWATCYNSLGLTLINAQYTPNSSRPGSSGTNASSSTMSSRISSNAELAIRVLAVDTEDNVMAIKHQQLPFYGVQFHPESCKSSYACRRIVRNWGFTAQKYRQQKGLPLEKGVERYLSAIPLLLGGQQNGGSNASESSTKAILSHLLSVSTTSGNRVQWRKVDTTWSREHISRFVNGLSNGGNVTMLESTKKGRFSIYALLETGQRLPQNDQSFYPSANWHIRYQRSKLSITTSDHNTCWSTGMIDSELVWSTLESFLVHKKATGGPVEVPFWGGFMGYLSYEQGLHSLGVEPQTSQHQIVPEMSLVWVERCIVYDNLTNAVYVQSTRVTDEPFLDRMSTLLSIHNTHCSETSLAKKHTELQSIFDTAIIVLPNQEQYHSRFHQCQSELHAGNAYELCLTTEATISIPKPLEDNAYEFSLYQNLHKHNPVPFGAFVKLADITILGTSPEQYMSWSRNGVVDMIPMKGTVKRSADMTFERASSILSSAKESAENLMIADLIRHDLYSALGHDSKVEVVKLCEVVEHETVYQLVSHIRAKAPFGDDLSDDEKQEQSIHYGLKTLRRTVPPGSMTGAPKKRSCEILSQLEQRNRGVYSGVLGYMDVGGGGNWNVCIRTAFRCNEEGKTNSDDGVDHDVWHLGAGGAITVLSDAEGEWQEMMVKLDSVLQGFKTVKS